MIRTPAFWRAAALRALSTVLVALLPFIAPLVAGGVDADWQPLGEAALALVLAAALSLATSLAGLPELGAGRSRWAAILDRVARTFGQTAAAALVAARIFSDVDWRLLLTQALAAALITAIRAAIAELPEVDALAPAPVGADGVADVTSLPAPGPRFAVGDLVRTTHSHAPGVVASVWRTDQGGDSYVLEPPLDGVVYAEDDVEPRPN